MPFLESLALFDSEPPTSLQFTRGSVGAVNPALTIAALAERCIEQIVEEDKIGK